MSVDAALLMIADIGGYTRFMRLHRTSLAHAQDIVARLLEAVIDAATGLSLVEVEGDAAFLYAPRRPGQEEPIAEAVARRAIAMHRAFHACQQAIVGANGCPCDGCRQTGQLRLKFVAHVGEVARQKVKHMTRLAGLDVIMVHRMLKNPVQVPEYILMSEALYRLADDRIRQRARRVEQELEGLGTVEAYFVDLEEIAGEPPSPAPATTLQRLGENWGLFFRTLPYLVGLKKPGVGFRNLAPA
jgi:class 3 adenylate cyclase